MRYLSTWRRKLLVGVLVLVFGTVVVGIGGASIPQGGTYTACVSRPAQSGSLKGVAAVGLLDPAVNPTCPSGSNQVTWGQQGPAGPQGPSGVLKVFAFDAQWSPANLPGNNGNTRITPLACRTGSYTAGSGEVAVVAITGTASPTAPVTDVLYTNAMVGINGGPLNGPQSRLNAQDSAESLQDGTANATVNVRYPLTAGTTYVFGAGFASNSAVSIGPAYCHGTVLIVRS
jgi:hypothetical protein